MSRFEQVLLLLSVVLTIIVGSNIIPKYYARVENCKNRNGIYVNAIGKCLNKNAIIDME